MREINSDIIHESRIRLDEIIGRRNSLIPKKFSKYSNERKQLWKKRREYIHALLLLHQEETSYFLKLFNRDSKGFEEAVEQTRQRRKIAHRLSLDLEGLRDRRPSPSLRPCYEQRPLIDAMTKWYEEKKIELRRQHSK
jgi:hypothetical protein